MAKLKKEKTTIQPADCIALLPEIPLPAVEEDQEGAFQRAELRRSILTIAELDHISETTLVQSVVKRVLGKLPALEESGGRDARLQ